MMKCLYIFKDKSKSKSKSKGNNKSKRDTNSASGLKNRTRSQNNSLSTNRSLGSLPSPKSLEELYKEKEHNLRVFSYQELRDATHVFNRILKLGEGGFGKVYKGSIRSADGQGDPFFVAIKRLNQLGLQGHKQWLAEVQFLGIVNHPNLVRLIGYCSEDYDGGIHRLLVYEYLPNRSLEDHLFSKALPPLPWVTRLEIMLGAAQGLAYLHEDLEVQVIYRDFKPSNVLLDSSFKAKLSDFGLAREGPTDDKSHVSTAPVGTYGYAAPEYVNTGHLTVLSDVWSYGVVLYEVLSGRRSIDRRRPTSEQKLLEWIKQFPPESKQFSIIIDPRLGNQYSVSAARKVAELADTCLNKNARERPSMGQVAHTLREAIKESQAACNLSENQGSIVQHLR